MTPSFARLNAVAPTDAEYKRIQGYRGTMVIAKARGDEMVDVTQRALTVIRQQFLNKTIGNDNGHIDVTSNDDKLQFAVQVYVEHGGSKVIIKGHGGGEVKDDKLHAQQRVAAVWIARSIAGLVGIAGGTADGEVPIKYTESL